MEVILLTQEQKNEIEGRKFTTDSYFLPIEDGDGNWVISTTEQTLCSNPDFDWIKHCPRIEYKPKPIPMPEEQTPVQE
jgi:hypothetical protein